MVELPAGTPIIVRPNTAGTWTGVVGERIPGAVYWWQRATTPATNAPIPSYDDGYQDGDMVDPLAEGERLPIRGVAWSDSMATSTNGDLAGRSIDNMFGGVIDGAWTTTKFDSAGNGRARVMSGIGLDLFDAAVAHIAPDPGILDGYRIGFDLNAAGTGDYGGINVRGDSLTSRTWGVWCRGTGTGTVNWTMRGWAPEDWQPRVPLGATPHSSYGRATITVQGPQITLTHNGTTLTHTLPAGDDTRPKQFAFASGRFGNFKARNIVFEAL